MYVPHHNRSLEYKTLKIFPSLLFYFHNFEYCYYLDYSGDSLGFETIFPSKRLGVHKKIAYQCILTLKSISYAHN